MKKKILMLPVLALMSACGSTSGYNIEDPQNFDDVAMLIAQSGSAEAGLSEKQVEQVTTCFIPKLPDLRAKVGEAGVKNVEDALQRSRDDPEAALPADQMLGAGLAVTASEFLAPCVLAAMGMPELPKSGAWQ